MINKDILELDYPYEFCPHCGKNVLDYIDPDNVIEHTDVRHERWAFGSADIWEDIFECPHCHKKFYIQDTYEY